MKATFDLPDELVRRLKLRAVHDGRKLKDVVADLLRQALKVPSQSAKKRKGVIFSKDKQTGFPVIVGPEAPRSGPSMTPEEMAQVLIDQEAEWAIDSSR